MTALSTKNFNFWPITILGILLLSPGAWAINLKHDPCAQQLLSFKTHLAQNLQGIWRGPYATQLQQRPDELLQKLSRVDQRKIIQKLQDTGSALANLRWEAFLSEQEADYRQNPRLRKKVARLRFELAALAKLFIHSRPDEVDDYTVFNGIKIYREAQLMDKAPTLWTAYKQYTNDLNALLLRDQDQQKLQEIVVEIQKSENILALGQNYKYLLQRWEDFARGNQELLQIGQLRIQNQFTAHLAALFLKAKAQLVTNLVINEITPYGPSYMVEILMPPNHRIPTWLKRVLEDWFTQPRVPFFPTVPQRRQLVVPQIS
ncbi:MAG: hypothetical protein J6Y94_04145 [Bacteriovoracaceae bacterium]|nr:hypothetical protein [Bacteriovoracaceae bacterium]